MTEDEPAQMQFLKDPELYQWHFFLRWHSRESEDHIREHEHSFIKVLNEALNWAGETSRVQSLTPRDVISLQVSERLATADWRERDNGVLRNLEARTLLDTFYIQEGQALQGSFEINMLNSLIRWVPSALDSEPVKHIYLGEAVCYCAEVDEGLIDNEDTLKNLMSEITKVIGDASLHRITMDGIYLVSGFLMMLPATSHDTFVLIYPSSQTSSVSRFVHYTLPQLFLSREKARRIFKEYNHSLLHDAEKQAQSLDSLLKQASKSRIVLEKLEQLSIDISSHEASFVEILSVMEDLLNTMRVNLHNMELLLGDPIWKDRQQAYQCFTGMMSLQIKQMETDLCYLNTTQKRADLVLHNLLTLVEVSETRWDRRITILLGLFAITGAISVFQDVLAWERRLILLLVGFVFVYWLIHKVKGE